jgi:CRISPR-associated protein Cmr2
VLVNKTQDLALVVADTDRTQDYVFESAKLPEIRGASRQLAACNEDLRGLTEQHGGEVIYAGGGGLLALAPREKAPELVAAIENHYPDQTRMATITAAWRPVTAEMLEQGYPADKKAPFGSLMRWAGTWLRREKERRATPPFRAALPHVERCASCQLRPADPGTLSYYPDWQLCAVCREKRRYDQRNAWFESFQSWLAENPAGHDEYYGDQEPFPELGDPTLAHWLPQDLSELGAACREPRVRGNVGFIYLDGDEIGKALENVPTKEEYTAFSAALEEAATTAVMSALADHLLPALVKPSPTRYQVDELPVPEEQLDAQGRMRIHPFEIITIGGDDLMLIVPADRAIPIAATISQRFQARMQMLVEPLSKALRERVYTLSGGVVLASDHNSVRVLRDLAHELQDLAKAARQTALRQGSEQEGYLDFMVLKSVDMLERDVSALRQQYPYALRQPGGKALSLLGRPYQATQLLSLWKALVALHATDFANTQMENLAAALFKGRQESTLYYLYQQARDKQGQYTQLNAALATVQKMDLQDPTPWVKWTGPGHKYSHQTALWDIAELYRFVGRTHDGN